MIILYGGIRLSVFLGDGEYKYKVVDNWAKLPENWSFNTFVVGITSNKKHILNGQMDVLLMIQKFV